jgi:hypothetical protein
MACKSCHSGDQRAYPAEINIHPPHTSENLDKPTVWAFPSLEICLNCGFTEFVLSVDERNELLNKQAHDWHPDDRRCGT